MTGELIVISGCMFSGKSQKVINKSEEAGEPIYFKPKKSKNPNKISSRNGSTRDCIPIDDNNPDNIMSHIVDENVVSIDEVQFFENKIVEVIQDLLVQGNTVIVSGLDLDFRGEPFEPMPSLMSLAKKVIKTTSECAVCGREATRTQRLIEGEPASRNDSLIIISSEKYEPRCMNCHQIN